jgi:acyl-CoA thioester hydrolase
MNQFRFFHPIEVRYGDLDPQGHVNNARHLTYFEQTRVAYLIHLGLFNKEQSFMEIGIILAEAQVTYLLTVGFGTPIHVGARTTRLGNKSFEMAYSLQDSTSEQELATGSATLVTFDYDAQTTIPIPDNWRAAIIEFENFQSTTGNYP